MLQTAVVLRVVEPILFKAKRVVFAIRFYWITEFSRVLAICGCTAVDLVRNKKPIYVLSNHLAAC